MGVQTVPLGIGQTGYQHPVELVRNLLSGLFNKTGVLHAGDFLVTPTANAQEVSISLGKAHLLGNAASTTQGGYYAWSDAAETKVFGVPSGNPRIDALVLRVVDTQYGSDPNTPKAMWEIVAGTPAGSPAAVLDSTFAPAGVNYRPGAWFRVADVLISPGDGVVPLANITQNYQYVAMPSGDALLERRVLTSNTGTVTFTIPQSYNHLRFIVTGKSTDTSNARSALFLRYNGDSGTNYGYMTYFATDYSGAAAPGRVDQASATRALGGWVMGSSSSPFVPSNHPGHCYIDIPNYSGSTWVKSLNFQSTASGISSTGVMSNGGSVWNNQNAITSISFTTEFGSF